MAKKTKKLTEAKRRYRANNVIRDIWHHLRSNAKRRGISCTISYEDFREWCIETDYHNLRGRTADKMSIDRIDHSKGYEKGNLQIKTVADNTIERNERYWKPIIADDEEGF